MSDSQTQKPGKKYIVLDSCVVAAHYIPESASRYARLAERASLLISAAGGPVRADQRLLIPAFCIPEVFSIFAKYRFGKWNTHVKNNTIDDLAYWKARLRFRNDIHNGKVIQQIALSRYIILATDLISPIDHHYEYYRSRTKKIRKVPMGAFDHSLIATGIDLVKCRGHNNVLIATADRRLGHILGRARKVRRNSAAKLGLIRTAKDLGLRWGPDIYPEVVNLATAKDVDLIRAFGEWPPAAKPALQTSPPDPSRKVPKLTQKQEQSLIKIYRGVTQETSESFLYTDEFEILYEAFIARTGLDVSRTQVWKWLSNTRKAGKLPRKRRKGVSKSP
jgi:hypothetical protein